MAVTRTVLNPGTSSCEITLNCGSDRLRKRASKSLIWDGTMSTVGNPNLS
jgi:hypothetical protein